MKINKQDHVLTPSVGKKVGTLALGLLSVGLLAFLPGCALKPDPASQNLDSVEYFQRMDRQDFLAKFGFLPPLLDSLMPPALAELPPQYQTAFSLFLRFDHDQRQIQAEYHYQKIMDPETHVQARKTLDEAAYHLWLKRLNGTDLVCLSEVGMGWSGPAPEYLRLRRKEGTLLIYAGSKNGPEGPDREEGNKGLRRHLCQEEVQNQLDALIAQLRG